MNLNVKAFLHSFSAGLLGAVPMILVFLFLTIPMFENRSMTDKKQGTEIAVSSIFEILTHFHAKQLKGELSEAQAKSAALDLIKQLRYKKSEYFWVNDQTPRMIMHPIKTELDGQDLSNYQDPHGKKVFVEMTKAVQSSEESGYVDYEWARPGSDQPIPKVSFVKLFKPWGWIVGSGIYVDDAVASAKEFKNTNMKYMGTALIFLLLMNMFVAIRQIRQYVIPVQNVIQDLKTQAESLSSSSTQLTSSSAELREASVEQESAMTQISSAVTEITGMMQSSLDLSQKSSHHAADTAKLSSDGSNAVSEVSKALNQITSASEVSVANFKDLNEKIQRVSDAMAQISTKTELINEIVFQTKLLSFNASVEAARAGEHGKGFSVVAAEIGDLASRSGQSSVEISKILKESQELVHTLVQESQQKVEQVASSTHSAISEGQSAIADCQNLLGQVAEKAAESNELSRSLLEAYQEQGRGVEEIAKSLEVIKANTSSGLASSDQTAELAQSVSASAQELKQAVEKLGRSV